MQQVKTTKELYTKELYTVLAFTKTDLTEMVGTVIHILSAVVTGKPKKTLTFIVSAVVDTCGTILTWVKFLTTKRNFTLTVVTWKRN